MKVLILIYTLCGDPQYMTVLMEGEISVYQKEAIPVVLPALGEEAKGVILELKEVLGGQCS